MHRSIHYEAAFEEFLRDRAVPYVPVDEARRVILAGARIKSFDLLVYPGQPPHWIVDIKGRRFPYVNEFGAKRYWENWVVQDDLDSLAEWETVFGDGFSAHFVFAYLLEGPPDRWPPPPPYRFRNEYYAFLAVPMSRYRAHCRRRSPKWNTVSVPTEVFREMVQPVRLAGSARPAAQGVLEPASAPFTVMPL